MNYISQSVGPISEAVKFIANTVSGIVLPLGSLFDVFFLINFLMKQPKKRVPQTDTAKKEET